jgi:hypothetical protein
MNTEHSQQHSSSNELSWIYGFDDRNNSKKRRHRMTKDEVQRLEVYFARNPLPKANERAQIANELGLTERHVQVWFQNKRQSQRRQQNVIYEAAYALLALSQSQPERVSLSPPPSLTHSEPLLSPIKS